jgi:hypothetical protein
MVLSAFPAMAPHQHGAYTVLIGLLDRSALYGVLAEIEASAWTCSRSASSPRTANHQDQVTAARRDGPADNAALLRSHVHLDNVSQPVVNQPEFTAPPPLDQPG